MRVNSPPVRDWEKLYFKGMTSKIAVIVFVTFVEFVAGKAATNSTN